MITAVHSWLRRRLPSGFAPRLAAVALGALAARLIYVLVLSPHLVGNGDSKFFQETANLIGSGRGYLDPLAFGLLHQAKQTAQHPPLTSVLLGGVSALGVKSYLGHRVAMCFVGAATVVALGIVAREAAGPRAGLIAAGLAALYPALVATDGAVMGEAPFGLFVAWSLLAAYRVAQDGGPAWGAALGAAVALSALTRAEGALLLPLLALPAARWALRRGLLALGSACLAFLVLLVPWGIRNQVVFHRFVPISTNYGTLAAGANCDQAYSGRDIGSWSIDCVGRVRGNEAEGAAGLRRRGLDYARDHSDRLPAVALARTGRTFSVYQPFRQARVAEGRQPDVEKAGAIAFWLLAALAVLGAVALRRRGGRLALLLAPMVVALAVSVTGYGVPRFREPADLAIVVLAAVALDSLAARRAVGSAARKPSPTPSP